MSTGHIIPGYEPPPPSDRPAAPPPPEPSHAERARTLVASQSRGALSTIALEPAGTPFGSVVTYGLDARGLRPVHEWTGGFEQFWNESFDRLDAYMQDLKQARQEEER